MILAVSAIATTPAGPGERWPDGYFTARDGTKLHYVMAGAGHPVILVHGAGGSAIGNWFSNGIAPKLAETNLVYALDMRGHGLSEGQRNRGPFNHSVMPYDVIDFMDHIGIEKAHMGGYSMGSHVLTQLMMIAPERFITASFQGGGVTETPEWRDRIPPDKQGRDPDQDKADELVKQRRLAKGEEIGNNFSDGQRNRQRNDNGEQKPAPETKEEAKDVSAVDKWKTRLAQKRMVKMIKDNMPAGEELPANIDQMALEMLPPPEMMNVFKQREEQLSKFDLTTIKFPVMAINGEFDRPNQKTHRLWRELDQFTNLVLPGKGHLTAMMAGFIPKEYVQGYAAFVARHNPPD